MTINIYIESNFLIYNNIGDLTLIMWEIYGEGGGQFNNLKDARE